MRFLMVSDFNEDPDSGAAGSILVIGKTLERLGHGVDYEWKDPRSRIIPHPSWSQLAELPRRQRRQVSRRLDSTHYDVVIVSQPYAYLVFERLAPQHPNTLFLNRTHGWEARVYDAYRRFEWDGHRSFPKRAASRTAERAIRRVCARTARSCQGMIAPASRCADYIARHYKLDPVSVAHIPYGVSEALIQQPRVRNSENNTVRLLYVGNYIALKGTSILEEILPPLGTRHPSMHLTFVIDDASVEAVKQRYTTFGNRLTVSPWVRRDELPGIYANHDVLLHPSLFEGFGKTWMEAMAAGVCVVGFAEGGLPDLAHHDHDALFCDAGDKTTLSNLLERCVVEPELPRRLGDNARSTIPAYTWERHAKATVRFCEERRRALV